MAAFTAIEDDITVGKPTKRPALHAFVSEEAHSAWHDYAANQGVSLSALLEAMGSFLDDFPEDMAETFVAGARRVDSDRRRRR